MLELRYNLGTGPAVIKTKTRVNTGKEIEVNVRVISEGKTIEKAWVNYSHGLAAMHDLKEYGWLSTNTMYNQRCCYMHNGGFFNFCITQSIFQAFLS